MKINPDLMHLYQELSPHFLFLTKPIVSTDKEIQALDKIFRKYSVQDVLDVACGAGRHSIPLSQLGYKITGIDISPFQIKSARKRALENHASAKFLLQDANNFNLPNQFDAAICMQNTLGEEPMEYPNVIASVFQALRRGGVFIIESNTWEKIPASREKIKKDFPEQNGVQILSLRDRYTPNFRIRDSITAFKGKEIEDVCITYLKRPDDWVDELKKAGFKTTQIIRGYKNQNHKVLIVGVKS